MRRFPTNNCPKVHIKVGTLLIPVLVDTGSSINLIERKVVTGPIEKLRRVMKVSTVAGVDGTSISETTLLVFELAGKRFEIPFFVVEDLNMHESHGILGIEAIQFMGVDLNSSSGCVKMKIQSQEVPLIGENVAPKVFVISEERDTQPHLAYVTHDVNIAPNTVQTVRLKVKGLEKGKLGCVMPTANFADLFAEDLLMCMDDEFCIVPLHNYSNNVIRLRPGEGVAVVDGDIDVQTIVHLDGEDEKDREKQLGDIILSQTPEQYHNVMGPIIKHFQGVFSLEGEPTGSCDMLPFEIETGSNKPCVTRSYRIPICHQEEVSRQIGKMVKEGIVSQSCSPYHSPIVLVKKKNGSVRLCIDFRQLNRQTEGDNYPLPIIDDLLAKVKNSAFYSCLDLKSGYHQVALQDSAKPKTAFSHDDVLYEFNKLPFGLRNAPSHFSRLMQGVLSGLIGSAVLVYLDDLIVTGATVEEHVSNLCVVLEALQRHKLRVRPEKCQFFKKEVEFLGHLVTPEGIKPLVDKIQAIREFPVPNSSRAVSSFLGLIGYYRKYIKGFGQIAKPLDGLRRCKEFIWTDEHTAAFETLRNTLTSSDILRYPDFTKPFIVVADASDTAIGAVISQVNNQGEERPVSFHSRVLRGAELNYSVLEKEALALRWVLRKNRYYLLGYQIILRSDHKPLKYLFEKSDLTQRQARWIEELLEFDIVGFDHVAGKSNVVADALSRGCGVRQTDRRGDGRTDSSGMGPPVYGLIAEVKATTRSQDRKDREEDRPTAGKRAASSQSGNESKKGRNSEETN